MRFSRVGPVVAVLGLLATADRAPAPRHGAPASPVERPGPEFPQPAAATISPADGRAPHTTTVTRAVHGYGKLPLGFEANHGQADGRIRFLARGRGYSLFLASTEAVFAFPQREEHSGHGDVAVLRMRFAGAAAVPRVVGLDELPGKVNYFIGRDPARWRTNVSTYARVKYEDVYPGIDLVYYGTRRHLEYDFIVAPGADPRTIGLAFEGADRLEIDGNGDLIARVPGGEVRQKKPFVYQERSGVREAIAGTYVRTGPRQVGFQVAAYDVSRPLVIDPQFVYSTYLGGSGEDHSLAVAVDESGSAYVAGLTKWGTNFRFDFPTTPGAFQSGARGLGVAFVTKLDASGSSLVYSTFLGGNFVDEARSIAVDRHGNAYVTGKTCSGDFPITAGAFQPRVADGPFLDCDAFVTKLNPAGSALLYSTYLGGTGSSDRGMSIAVDADGNAHVAGSTDSADFPTTFEMTVPGTQIRLRVFAVKLNSSGTGLVYSTLLGDTTADMRDGRIAVDASGNAYVAGQARSARVPTTPGVLQPNRVGVNSGFVVKLDPAGTVLYSTYLPGAAFIEGLAVDASGSAYVAGTAFGGFPVVNPIQPVPAGGLTKFTVFAAKLNPTASALVYSTLLGGTVSSQIGAVFDHVRGLAVDGSGNAWVSGFTLFSDFPTTEGAFQRSLRGPSDAFVAKLDPSGSVLLYSTYLGGDGTEGEVDTLGSGPAIAVDASGSAYVSGSSTSTNFPTTAGAFRETFGGGKSDAFVAKISPEEALVPLQFVTFPAALPSLPREGQLGVPYVGNIGIGGGRPPYEITIVSGGLPPGLRFNSPVITGIPTLAQVQAFLSTVQVRDALGSLITRDVDITVLPSSLEPFLRVVAASLEFGSVLIGSPAELTLTVSNPSGGTLAGSVAPPGGDFSIVSGESFSLGPGQSQAVVVRFSPVAEGAVFGALHFTSNGGDDTKPLTGTGVAAMLLAVATAGGGLGVVRSDLEGIDCGPTCSRSYPRGAVVTLTATPAASSVLAGWTGGGCGTPTDTCTVVMDEARSVTAVFALRPPDLVVSALTLATSTGAPGGRLRVTATVENRSLVAAPPSVTRYCLSADAVKDSSDRLLGPSQKVPALAPGERVTRTTTLALPRSLAPGTYTLLACADAAGRLVESDESNNCLAAATPLEIVGPDLVVDGVTPAPASLRAGASLDVTALIRNRGTVRSERSTTRYYLSANSSGAGSERLPFGSRALRGVEAGATARTIAPLRVPLTLPAGSYFVLACVDDLHRVVETDEANNCGVSPAPIQVQGR